MDAPGLPERLRCSQSQLDPATSRSHIALADATGRQRQNAPSGPTVLGNCGALGSAAYADPRLPVPRHHVSRPFAPSLCLDASVDESYTGKMHAFDVHKHQAHVLVAMVVVFLKVRGLQDMIGHLCVIGCHVVAIIYTLVFIIVICMQFDVMWM